MKKPIIRAILTIALVTATVTATAVMTYRQTMKSIIPSVNGNTLTLTVFGHADVYDLGTESVSQNS